MQLAAGTIVDERFRIERLMGCGGMGVVYRALQLNLDRPVALKFVNVFGEADTDATQRLEREAVVLSQLHHHNIVSFYGLGTWAGEHYIVLEYVEGEPLEALLESGKPLSWSRTLRIIEQIACALKQAHSLGIVHRDLKPGNVILTGQGEGEVVRLIDFGMAKLLPEFGKQLQRLTQTGTAMGTLLYMSPEQCVAGPIDRRTDIYALGAILFHCLSGRPPFWSDCEEGLMAAHVAQAPPDLGNLDVPPALAPSLEEIVHRCMAKDPADRYDNADELLEDLHKVQQLKPIEHRRSSRREPFLQFQRFINQPNNALRVLAAVAAASAIFVLAGSLWLHFRQCADHLARGADETQGASDMFYKWRALRHPANAAEVQKVKYILDRNQIDHSLDMNQAALDELYADLSRCYIQLGQLAQGWQCLNEGWSLTVPGRPEPHSSGKKNVLGLALRISNDKMFGGTEPESLMKAEGGVLRDIESAAMNELEYVVVDSPDELQNVSAEVLACAVIQFERLRGDQRALHHALELHSHIRFSRHGTAATEAWDYWGNNYRTRDPQWAQFCLEQAYNGQDCDDDKFSFELGLDYSRLAATARDHTAEKLWQRSLDLLKQSTGHEPERTVVLAQAYQSLGQTRAASDCIDKVFDAASRQKPDGSCWKALHRYADILRAQRQQAELDSLLTKVAAYERQNHTNVTVQI